MRIAAVTVVYLAALLWLLAMPSWAHAHVTVWTRLADCETGDGDGRYPYRAVWHYNGRSGFDGGLQFHPGTWSAYRFRSYPRYAWQASPSQQIAVAYRVLRDQGWRAWPACSRRLGLR